MHLEKFEYHFTGAEGQNDWNLLGLELSELNLLVGKNGTGKSKSIHAIEHFAHVLKQKEAALGDSSASATFNLDDGRKLTYSFAFEAGKIKAEKLSIDGHTMVDRDEDKVSMYSEVFDEMRSINPPKELLVLHSRRDEVEYSYFEPLAEWANVCMSFRFSHEGAHPIRNYVGNPAFQTRENFLTAYFKDFEENSKALLLDNLKHLGFNFEKIVLQDTGESEALLFYPSDLEGPIYLRDLSQGMFRAFSILSVLRSRIQYGLKGTQLIDDLCEGLDYERATLLGKLIFDLAKENGIQLIASSNDSFLMNVVNLKYWNVLVREGTLVRSLNYKNSKALFEKFKFSGLSNFDFFSTEYLLENS